MTRRLTVDDLEDYHLEPDIEQTLAGPFALTELVPLAQTFTALEELVRATADATKDPRQQSSLEHYANTLQGLGTLSDGGCGLALDPESRRVFIRAAAVSDWSALLALLSAFTEQVVARRQSVPGWMLPTRTDAETAVEYRYEVESYEDDNGVLSWEASCREMPRVRAWGDTPGAAIDAVVKKVASEILPALVREYNLVPRPAR